MFALGAMRFRDVLPALIWHARWDLLKLALTMAVVFVFGYVVQDCEGQSTAAAQECECPSPK